MITPADGASAPSQYSAVPEAAQDIMAPQDDLSGVAAGAVSEAMARQPETERLLSSPQGFGAFSITAGASGGGGEDWPGSIVP